MTKKQSLFKIAHCRLFACLGVLVTLGVVTNLQAQHTPLQLLSTTDILNTDHHSLYTLDLEHQYPLKNPQKLNQFLKLVPSFEVEPLPVKIGSQIENSSLFNSSAKALKKAILAFEARNWPVAQQQFQAIAGKKNDIALQAKLWLGWLHWAQQQNTFAAKDSLAEQDYQTTLQAAFAAQQVENEDLKNEGLYLQALVYFQQKKYRAALELLKKWQANAVLDEEPSVRFLYLQINILRLQQNWLAALDTVQILLDEFDDDHPLYSNWVELSGLVLYHLQRFEQSQAVFLELLDEYPEHQQASYWQKQLAWLAFFQNETVDLNILPTSNEKKYLRLHIAHQQQDPDKVERYLSQLPINSIWHETATIFLLEGQLMSLETRENLAKNTYEHPLPKAYIALYNGNQQWQQENYLAAEYHYRNALEKAEQQPWACMLHYQLGLTHLKKGNAQAAQARFENCVEDGLSLYQLYFILYQQKNWAGILNLQHKPEPPWTAEVDLMIAEALFQEQSAAVALEHLQKSWQTHPDLRVLELAFSLAQKTDTPNPLAKAEHPNTTSNLQAFEAQATMVNPEQALQHLTPRLDKTTEFYWLTQWQALSLLGPQPLVKASQSSPIINPSDSFLLAQNLYLANAYTQLNQLKLGQNYYYKALQFNQQSSQKLKIEYNLFYLSVINADYDSAISQGESLVKKINYGELHWAIVYWLGEAYQQVENYEQALALYNNQLKTHPINFLQLAKTQTLWLSQQYPECQKYSLQKENHPDYKARVEQIYLGGLCALNEHKPGWVVRQHKPLVEDADPYQDPKLLVSLSKAYAQLNNPQRQLAVLGLIHQEGFSDPAEQNTILLTLATAYLANQQPTNAQTALGDLQNYRNHPEYLQALRVQAQIYADQGLVEQQARYLLRLYYQPGLSTSQKPLLALTLSELMLKIQQPKNAQSLWAKIQPETLPPAEQARYAELTQQFNTP